MACIYPDAEQLTWAASLSASEGATAAGCSSLDHPLAGREHRGTHVCCARFGEAVYYEGPKQHNTVSVELQLNVISHVPI